MLGRTSPKENAAEAEMLRPALPAYILATHRGWGGGYCDYIIPLKVNWNKFGGRAHPEESTSPTQPVSNFARVGRTLSR
jgi:hypothetical protein